MRAAGFGFLATLGQNPAEARNALRSPRGSAFDDGAMPTYELPQLPGRPVPFWGLQDVTCIELPPGTAHEEILNVCRRHCRSDHFVLVDEYGEIRETFLLGAAMSAEHGKDITQGYRIYKTSL